MIDALSYLFGFAVINLIMGSILLAAHLYLDIFWFIITMGAVLLVNTAIEFRRGYNACRYVKKIKRYVR